jgi:YidC/Oxa1 family membrane protein insertase
MIGTAFNLVFFQPLYNALVWLTDVLPGGDIGLAVIILTLVVRFILFPLQHKMTRTQHKLRELEGQIKDIKEKHSKNPQEQAKEMMALYREHGISPFSGFVLLLIQIPVLLALYWVFSGGLVIKPELLYSFVSVPSVTNSLFLGLIDLSRRSIILALVAGVAQYAQVHFAMPPIAKRDPNAPADFKTDLARSMSLQMKFVFPVMIVIFSLSFPSVVALYWITTSLFSVVHELVVKRKAKTLSPVINATN